MQHFLPRSLTKIDFSITGLQECNNQEVAAQATKKVNEHFLPIFQLGKSVTVEEKME